MLTLNTKTNKSELLHATQNNHSHVHVHDVTEFNAGIVLRFTHLFVIYHRLYSIGDCKI